MVAAACTCGAADASQLRDLLEPVVMSPARLRAIVPHSNPPIVHNSDLRMLHHSCSGQRCTGARAFECSRRDSPARCLQRLHRLVQMALYSPTGCCQLNHHGGGRG